MDINLEKTIEGVCENPVVIDGHVFIIRDQKLYPDENLRPTTSIDISQAYSKRGSCPWIVCHTNGKLILYNLDGNFLEVDPALKSIGPVPIKGSFMSLRASCGANNGFSFLKKTERKKGVFGFYDLDKKAVFWEVETQSCGTSFAKNNATVICKTDNHQKTLAAYTLRDGNKLWEKEIGPMGNYTDVLGLLNEGVIRMEAYTFNHSLIFGVDGHLILSMDMVTGKENWKICTDDPHPFFGLDQGTGLIHIMDYQQYHIHDATTGQKIYSTDIKGIYELLGIDVSGLTEFVFTTHCLITVQCEEGILMVLDKNNGNLLWHYNFKEMVPVFNSPKILNNKLYVLTKSGKLHLFKINEGH